MDPLLVKALGRAAGQLARPAVSEATSRTKRYVLGDDDERLVRRITTKAVERAVESLLEGTARADVAHVVSIMELVVNALQANGVVALLESRGPDPEGLRTWHQAAAAAGVDVDTLPVRLDDLVVAVVARFREELEREARRPGSPLFATFILAELNQLQAEVEAVRMAPAETGEARQLPFARNLHAVLSAFADRARLNDRRFLTPDVLAALLAMPDGAATGVFDSVEPGLAERFRRVFVGFIDGRAPGPFSPVTWNARRDVRLAQDFAWLDGAAAVTDAHLLCAVLATPSNTRTELREVLGPQFRLLYGLAAEARLDALGPCTPRLNLGDVHFGPT
ncbi:MAG TPA: hypothetical protein VNA20_00050 [Frankiaceae bacterium]|nr:hypothetical protein [Frankiaceae bacterium]